MNLRPLRPEPPARVSHTGVEHGREAPGRPTHRRRVAPLLYFAAVPLAKPTLVIRVRIAQSGLKLTGPGTGRRPNEHATRIVRRQRLLPHWVLTADGLHERRGHTPPQQEVRGRIGNDHGRQSCATTSAKTARPSRSTSRTSASAPRRCSRHSRSARRDGAAARPTSTTDSRALK